MSHEATLGAGKDAISLWCWFVEDDGAGHSGYATVDGRAGYAPPAGGGLFPTIEDIRDAISRQDNKTPWIVPHYGGEVPKGWRIRGLTTNEVERLGLAYNTMWNQP